MASIQRIVSPLTGEVSYRAQVRVKGHATQGKTFPNKKEAANWATSIESAIRENRYFPHSKAARTLFADVVGRYRESVLKGTKKEAKCNQHLDWWLARFVSKTLAEITPDLIAEARDELAAGTYTRGRESVDAKTGRTVAPQEFKRSGATVNRYLATLSHLFTIATREWRLVDRNPVKEIGKKRENRGRTRFLSDEERQSLLDACRQSSWSPLYALVLLAITTGARRGELINLRWSDVDLKKNRAFVHETKNSEPRVLPLVSKAVDAVRELKLQNSARSDYVFPHPNGFPAPDDARAIVDAADSGALMKAGPFTNFDAHWYEALERAGIENMRFHDLRHTTASYLAQQGATLLEIADTLGHKTLAMVKRYAHLTQTHKVSAIERMAKEKGL